MDDLYCWQSKYESCSYAESLLKKIYLQNEISNYQVNVLKIKKAIYYAKKYHFGQMRDSGEPYYSHPLAVAEMVIDFYFDENAIIASILHDLIEDTNASVEDISSIFGYRVAEIVERLTRFNLPNSNSKISSEQLIMQAYILNDSVVVLIKLLDRLHNLQSIHVKTKAKRKKIDMEVLQTFYLLSFKLDSSITKKFQDYLNLNNIIQKQEHLIFSYGTYQLEPLKFQNNF